MRFTACAAGSKSARETDPLGQIRANGLSQFLQGNMNTRLHLGLLACVSQGTGNRAVAGSPQERKACKPRARMA